MNLLFLLSGPEFLLFIFKLYGFWVLLPQIGAPLLLIVLLLRGDLRFRDRESELLEVWKKDKTENLTTCM